jgi:hypothetical protein
MKHRKGEDEIERRLDDLRRLLRGRRVAIEPDPFFADRVVARLPRNPAWSFDWAARRILPVSLALALALTIAAVATGRPAGARTEPVSASTTSQTGNDPLEWLLDGRQDLR